MIHELHELLARAGARVRSVRLWSSLAVCWLFWAVVVWGVAQMATPGARYWPALWSALGALAFLTALTCWIAVRRVGRDPHHIAQRIEATHPELGAMLLAALETAPQPKFKRLGYLQAAVVRGAVTHGRQHDWANATSRGRLQLAKVAHFASLAALASACLLLADRTVAHGNVGDATSNRDELAPGAGYDVEIQPGNAEIERGSTLLVLARFKGALPPDAELVVRETVAKPASRAISTEPVADGAAAEPSSTGRSTRAMTRSLDDPQFVGRIPGVAGPLSYHVEFAGQRSPWYSITVFDYPELDRADARLDYPDYTRLDDKVVEDVRRVTAVEGTQLTLQFRLNKDVDDARLVDRDGEELVLRRGEGADPVYEASYALARSQRFKLHLLDREKRRNKLPPDIVVDVTTNKPAEIKIAKPARDMRVSPLEELRLAGTVSDDFGVAAYGVSYALGGDEPIELKLNGAAPRDGEITAADTKPLKKAGLEHLIDFEALDAEPDQLVSYFLWAEDIGPDGQARRSLSDMYFAEVRHFDEIFRQGEQPTEQQQREQQQQQGQQAVAGQQAEELAEIQKQVINATWKLLRRETSAQPTADFATDATAVKEGQQQAIDKLAELAEQVTDSQSTEFVAAAEEHMERALAGLSGAIDASDPTSLRAALSAEQSAYQALLKLRAREFNVARSNQQQQQGQQGAAGNSASQQQLQQLELSAEENRYETQSRAAAANQENAAQLEESRQILNRLSELARRQEDLNKRLRELLSALQEADTSEERAELERQLKRLRDQQREVLRDAEQLNNDMQGSENAQQMQDAAEQLSETRSRVQEASEALDEGQVSEALTEGARAERELSELRDDFRRRTADRFTEEMRNLRDAAQQLDERQEQLSQQLDDMNAPGRRTLRDTGPREEFLKGLGEQQRELEQTLETMRETVTEAEEPEPLLARQLYDAVQDATDQRTSEALDTARQLTEAGVSSEASEAMRQADRGIEQLRQQIDRAAESVLGDETEALRRASDRLQGLADALNQEIADARGERGEREAGGEPGNRQGQGERFQTGEPGEQTGQPGEGQQASDGQQPGPRGDGGREPGDQQSVDESGNEDAQPDESQRGEGRTAGEQSRQGRGQGGGQQPTDDSQSRDAQGQGGQSQGQRPGEQGEQQQGESQSESGHGQEQGRDGQQPGEVRQGQGEGSQGQGGQSGSQPGDGPRAFDGGPSEATPSDAQADPSAEEQPQAGGQPAGANPGQRGGGSRRTGGGGGIGNLDAFQDAFNGVPRADRGPITGEDFRNWSEGMREVEDMLDDPELASEAARIRDRAEQARVDFVRRAKSPDWEKVVEMVADPLVELQTRIQEEIRRKESPDALAPIERDAAPAEFAEEVRIYYQRLGSGE